MTNFTYAIHFGGLDFAFKVNSLVVKEMCVMTHGMMMSRKGQWPVERRHVGRRMIRELFEIGVCREIPQKIGGKVFYFSLSSEDAKMVKKRSVSSNFDRR